MATRIFSSFLVVIFLFFFLGYKCQVFFQEGFLGLTNVPVFCYACNDCLDEVSNMLRASIKPFDEQVPVHENVGVSIKKLHKKYCKACGGGKKRSQRVTLSEDDIVHRRLHQENCETCRNNRWIDWRRLRCFWSNLFSSSWSNLFSAVCIVSSWVLKGSFALTD